jgi:1,4-alpha-glucan branching enzyme
VPASLDHIDANTPMGATLVPGGATFRVWAPHAREVYVVGEFNDERVDDSTRLTRNEQGHFRGFVPGVRDRQRYLY